MDAQLVHRDRYDWFASASLLDLYPTGCRVRGTLAADCPELGDLAELHSFGHENFVRFGNPVWIAIAHCCYCTHLAAAYYALQSKDAVVAAIDHETDWHFVAKSKLAQNQSNQQFRHRDRCSFVCIDGFFQ